MTTTDPDDPHDGRRSRVCGPVTEAERKHMQALAADGNTAPEIAAVVGRNKATVYRHVRAQLDADRARTAKAAEGRRISAAERRTRLITATLGEMASALMRLRHIPDDAPRDYAQAARALADIGRASTELTNQEARTHTTQSLSQVDAWLEHIAGEADPDLMPPDLMPLDDDPDAAPRGADHP